jgi:hypothetical protein
MYLPIDVWQLALETFLHSIFSLVYGAYHFIFVLSQHLFFLCFALLELQVVLIVFLFQILVCVL